MRIANYKNWIMVIGLLLASVNIAAQNIQQSHLGANLPNTFEEFKIIIDRDLQVYFSEKLKSDVTVVPILLREAPTQSGVSYPKFYAWVNVLKSNQVIYGGAVRVAAIDKVRVEVTHFFSKEQIRKQPQAIERVFPLALCDEIRIRAGVQ